MQNRPYGHVVVAGGSLAGLLATHVLAKHFARVTVVERDPDVLPTAEGSHRRGVPQDKHLHILMALGRQLMENLIPGLTEELIAAGAVTADLTGEIRYVFEGNRAKRGTTGMPSLLAGRALIESHIRDRARALGNVEFRPGHEVTGLLLERGKNAITGVRVSPAGDFSQEERIDADLVIDATGRGGRGVSWLREAGLEAPEEDEVAIDIVYTTRHFRRQVGDLGDDKAIIVTPSVQNRRGGAMNAQENGDWIVTLFGYLGEQAPVDLEGFTAFAEALAVDDIHQVITKAEPLDDGALIRFPASRRRHYEKLGRLPGGYLTIGDALCSFNPVYGQGMTVAAVQADALDTCLRERDGRAPSAGLSTDFYTRVAPVIEGAWANSVGGDLKYPEVKGDRTPQWEQITAYMTQMYQASTVDDEVTRTLVRLINLVDGPEVLQDPAFAARVQEGAARSTRS